MSLDWAEGRPSLPAGCSFPIADYWPSDRRHVADEPQGAGMSQLAQRDKALAAARSTNQSSLPLVGCTFWEGRWAFLFSNTS